MPVLIKVSQNQIKDAKSFGKFYGHVVSTKTMTYAELCKHMAEHNSVYGEDVCLGVANKLQSCLLEQLLEGKKVQFGDLGTFYLSVKGTGVDNEEDSFRSEPSGRERPVVEDPEEEGYPREREGSHRVEGEEAC